MKHHVTILTTLLLLCLRAFAAAPKPNAVLILGGDYEAPAHFGFDEYALWQLNRRPGR